MRALFGVLYPSLSGQPFAQTKILGIPLTGLTARFNGLSLMWMTDMGNKGKSLKRLGYKLNMRAVMVE